MAPYPKLCKAIEHLVDEWGPVEGRTRMMKLIYLADFEWAKSHNSTSYTEAGYYRWNHGPFSREVLEALEWMDGIEIVESTTTWDGGVIHSYRSGASTRLSKVEIDSDFTDVLDEVGNRWRNRSLKDLLDYVYGEEEFKKKAFGQPLL